MGLTYRLNEPQAACETLADDLMLLHFGSGLYYNLQGTGADVCAYLLAGGTREAAIATLTQHFALEAAAIAPAIDAFVDQLVAEGLLAPAPRPPNESPMRITAKTYEPPRCLKYDDMADQLLLDKIDDQSPEASGPASLEI